MMLSECIVTGRGLIVIDSYTWTEIEIVHIMKVKCTEIKNNTILLTDSIRIRYGRARFG